MTLRTYREIKNEFDTYKVDTKNGIGIILISIFLSLLIIVSPTVILINLLIYNEYRRLISFGFATLIVLFAHFIELFFDLGVSKGKIKDIYVLSFTHTIFRCILFYGILLCLFLFEVI